MISSTIIKLSVPFARTSLVGVSLVILLIAVITIYHALNYPYLIDSKYEDLYLRESHSISSAYTIISFFGILVALSTGFAAYKPSSNYILVHAGLMGLFVPALVVAFFTTNGDRYNPANYITNEMIVNYEIEPGKKFNIKEPLENVSNTTSTVHKMIKENLWKHIDDLQKNRCCGVLGKEDWKQHMDGFIPSSCCKDPGEENTETGRKWREGFGLDDETKISFCADFDAFPEGCLETMIEDEGDKKYRLGILLLLLGILSTADTIVSLLIFALSNIGNSSNSAVDENFELSVIGEEVDPAVVTSIKPRPSVASGCGDVATRAQAVRFQLSNSPRHSISGPSKFSAAARRGSSFI